LSPRHLALVKHTLFGTGFHNRINGRIRGAAMELEDKVNMVMQQVVQCSLEPCGGNASWWPIRTCDAPD